MLYVALEWPNSGTSYSARTLSYNCPHSELAMKGLPGFRLAVLELRKGLFGVVYYASQLWFFNGEYRWPRGD